LVGYYWCNFESLFKNAIFGNKKELKMVMTTIELDRIEDLSSDFLRRIKVLARGKRAKITIQLEEAEDYLTQNPQMKTILDNRIKNIESDTNIVTFDTVEDLLRKLK
jgi:hypothetical protein